MPSEHTEDLTRYLRRWHAGDVRALDDLLPRVYERLRDIAHARLRGEESGNTLDTSALVHETYLRLVGGTLPDWQDRNHFFAVASTTMRRILIDHAKEQRALKRGGDAVRVPLEHIAWDDSALAASTAPDAMLALDDALTRLAEKHPRQAKAVELRYFAGLTLDEAANVLETSAPTVLRDLRFAQAWLARDLG